MRRSTRRKASQRALQFAAIGVEIAETSQVVRFIFRSRLCAAHHDAVAPHARHWPAAAVVQGLNAAAKASGRDLSPHLLRLPSKMSVHLRGRRPDVAAEELREAARELVDHWNLTEPNPEEHALFLDTLALWSARGEGHAGSARDAILNPHTAEASRLVQMAIEIDVVSEDLSLAVQRLADDGHTAAVLSWIERGASPALGQRVRSRLLTPASILQVLLASDEADALSARAAAQDDEDAPQLAQWLEDGLVEELDTFSWISASDVSDDRRSDVGCMPEVRDGTRRSEVRGRRGGVIRPSGVRPPSKPACLNSVPTRDVSDVEVAATRVPLREVETVIRSVSLAMQTEQDALLPLVKLKSVDQYTTVHACNVAMLSMALAESLGGGSREVRAVGTAALLHDIGKVRLPAERLSHPGALSTSEQEIMRPHSVEGARLLGERGAGNALAAIVAYAQHICANGKGGYPGDTFPRRPHAAAHAAPGRP